MTFPLAKRFLALIFFSLIFLSCGDDDAPETDVNNAPAVNDQNFTVEENASEGTAVGIVVASDSDQDDIAFSITSGNTGSVFEMDQASGEITVNGVLDFEVVPEYTLQIAVSDGTDMTTANIMISLTDISRELFTTEAQLMAELDGSYNKLNAYAEFSYVFDAVYANEIAAPDTDWNATFGHTLTSMDGKVNDLWSGAWDILYTLNSIALSTENVISGTQTQNEIIAEALTMRGFLFLHLLNWYGALPLDLGVDDQMLARSTMEEVLQLIQSDLQSAVTNLPASRSGAAQSRFTANVAKAVLCRSYLWQLQWPDVLNSATELINDEALELNTVLDNFETDKAEIIWGFDATGNITFNNMFTKGTFVPLIRLTESYLARAESNAMSGFAINAIDDIDVLRIRREEAELPNGPGQEELLGFVFEQWQKEMKFEGMAFMNLKRFGKAETELSIQSFQLLLPIPQGVIDTNDNFFQNPGY
ncbi:RagB/SusD family nutrient uptake outer membrane protein [Fulvivirga sp. M361]|uniref:RagB/SusD family nutrient uptake outer membrane protein n=1 Tax=Fulvivirga sp. M361 TaxID=2594266 RepID=UPI00117B8B85|nr:RagB/SusD family nutrient uptake outer membrane protein [Fulvivirga sp. M361]TRX51409.1 RagB/SusD family nutrient uptake outer membrane protein [Fulvivirga sp. M361]